MTAFDLNNLFAVGDGFAKARSWIHPRSGVLKASRLSGPGWAPLGDDRGYSLVADALYSLEAQEGGIGD